MSEKRRHQRVTAQGLASYVWVGSKLSSSIIENISAGGLFYRTPKPVAPGTTVRIRLVQPGLKEPVELTGTVVSCIEPATAIEHGIIPGSGIRFDPVAEPMRERFNRLLVSLGLPPVDASAVPAPIAARPAGEKSDAVPTAHKERPGFSYSVYQADAKVEMPTRREATAPAPKVQPQPIEFELAPARPVSASRADDPEKQRLMTHIQGLLKQLTEVEEKLRLRDRELAELRAELELASAARS